MSTPHLIEQAPMLSFEIVNPSDPYTFKAPDIGTAAIVLILLGNGQYCGKSLDTPAGEEVPFFMFGGTDEWFKEKCDCTAQEFMERLDRNVLAASLESVAMPDGRSRTSMNNIGARAKNYAESFRAALAKAEALS